MGIGNEIRKVVREFEPISLKEVNRASLLSRKDCKYIFSVDLVPQVLRDVVSFYRILEIGGLRSHIYQTTYYDTPSLDMYMMHHNGRVNRHKVRMRKYWTSDDMFLEVKKKNAKGVTVKNRVQTNGEKQVIMSSEEEFLESYTPYERKAIEPVLENSFYRISMVDREQSERVTLDYNLWFSSMISDDSMELSGIAIAEVKYQGQLTGSPMHGALRNAGVVPRRFSKYCTGMAMLHPEIKQNLFKEKVRMVRKINDSHKIPTT